MSGETVQSYEIYTNCTNESGRIIENRISSFYGVDSKSETAAYLQGEIAKKMFPAVAIAVCPKCHHGKGEER